MKVKRESEVAQSYPTLRDPIDCSLPGSSIHGTQETWVRSLDQEDPLEEGTVTHSSFLAWRISWTEEPGGLQSMGLQRVGYD